MTAMQVCLTTEMRIGKTTLATRRNIDDLIVVTDLADVDSLLETSLVLPSNNVDGNVAAAEFILPHAVDKFLYIACSEPLQLTLQRIVSGSPVDFVVSIDRIFAVTAAFSLVKIKNISQTSICKARIIAA